jgi:hypothetical protein
LASSLARKVEAWYGLSGCRSNSSISATSILEKEGNENAVMVRWISQSQGENSKVVFLDALKKPQISC